MSSLAQGPDLHSTLAGRHVRIETLTREAYTGIVCAVDPTTATLAIRTPAHPPSYTYTVMHACMHVLS